MWPMGILFLYEVDYSQNHKLDKRYFDKKLLVYFVLIYVFQIMSKKNLLILKIIAIFDELCGPWTFSFYMWQTITLFI